jgi:hypothetical protein
MSGSMSIVRVQCKGSGQNAKASLNAKRATCPWCHRQQDVASNGNLRKHMRMARTRNLK